MRYPELPQYRNMSTYELEKLYNDIQTWASQIINELDARDVEINNSPSTQIYTETTVTNIGRPIGGAVAYSTSSGKYYGWDAVTSVWAAFN